MNRLLQALAVVLVVGVQLGHIHAQARPVRSDPELWAGLELTKSLSPRSSIFVGLWPVMFNERFSRIEDGQAYVGATHAARPFLKFGASYRFVYHDPSTRARSLEHRWSGDVTARLAVKQWFTISEGIRGDLRLIDGRFSERFANRIQVERTFSASHHAVRPYIAFEPFYSTRSHRWNKKRYYAGFAIQLTPHWALDLAYLRETDSLANPGSLHVLAPLLRFKF